MCQGFGPTNINSGASAGWTRATLELKKSRQAATRVPLRGTAGRVNTSRVAEQAASCRTGLLHGDPRLLLSSSKPERASILARGRGYGQYGGFGTIYTLQPEGAFGADEISPSVRLGDGGATGPQKIG
ncbi:hypothetical protein NDU88_003447 [Pleurodeles waltl]|uniref:Uncharacterized protein n=1 Tax=Pleurodeles waltl TaxID=8319 RepID=A0AAV7M4C2_PLEWA|nr:hypothetical protein NDU88_003447 [Pleurodeles waltl]